MAAPNDMLCYKLVWFDSIEAIKKVSLMSLYLESCFVIPR